MAESLEEPKNVLGILEDHHCCPICQEICCEITSTNCGHIFCQHCIETWREARPTCPLCSTGISSLVHLHASDQLIETLMGSFVSSLHAKKLYLERKEHIRMERRRTAAALKKGLLEFDGDANDNLDFQQAWMTFTHRYRKFWGRLDRLMLIPQSEPICATQPGFCLKGKVILTLNRARAIVKTCSSQATLFKWEFTRAWGLGHKILLKDGDNAPVLQLAAGHTQVSLLGGGGASDPSNILCVIRLANTIFKRKWTATFHDRMAGTPRRLVLKGNISSTIFAIYLGEPKRGGVPVAKIYAPLRGNEYQLEIGANVDIALVTCFCLLMIYAQQA